jgi:hypothetical protein
MALDSASRAAVSVGVARLDLPLGSLVHVDDPTVARRQEDTDGKHVECPLQHLRPQRPEVECVGDGEGAADMRGQHLEQVDVQLPVAMRLRRPGGMHGGHAPAGPQSWKPDDVLQSVRLENVPVEAAFEQLIEIVHRERADMTDVGDDIRGRHRRLRVVLAELLQKRLLVAEHEQLVVLDVLHVVNADAARRTLAEIGDLPACGCPKLRIEGAVVDGANGVGQRLGGNSLQTDHDASFILL